jgi:hypothetical protein
VTMLRSLLMVALTLTQMAFARAHADEASDLLYPGRYAASCKPGPMFGCVCETDSGRQVSIFPQFTSDAAYFTGSNPDVEYLRMVEWLRRTCQAVTQSRNLR